MINMSHLYTIFMIGEKIHHLPCFARHMYSLMLCVSSPHHTLTPPPPQEHYLKTFTHYNHDERQHNI